MTPLSRRDDMLGAISVIVLLIGTATGNAWIMLGLSLATMVVLSLCSRPHLGTSAVLAGFLAAVTAAIIGLILAMH